MAETQKTGTAKKQTPKPEPKSKPQPATAQPAPAATPQPVVPQPAQPAQPPAQPEPTKKPEEKPTVQTDSKRTQGQFDKLLENNKRLYDANEQLRTQLTQKALANEQFAPIQQPPIQQQPAQTQVSVADFVEVDPVSGERFIDDKKLQSKIEDLNSKATKAEDAVQRYIQTSEQREIDRQNEEAFDSYPELNPTGENHDVRFHNQTRALIYDSLINPQDYGGKPLSFKKAADFVKGGDNVTDNSEKNKQAFASKDEPGEQTVAANEPSTEGEDAKQQAAASVAGEQPEGREAPADSEELSKLQQATRLGDTEALAKRIANTDHIQKESESGDETTT